MRTPIRSLRGFFDLFDQSFLTDIQREYLRVIRYNSDLIFEILNRLLLYSRYDEGNFKIVKTEFNFRQTVNAVVDSFKILYRSEKQNRIRLEYSPTIPDILVGDAVKFQLILSLSLIHI